MGLETGLKGLCKARAGRRVKSHEWPVNVGDIGPKRAEMAEATTFRTGTLCAQFGISVPVPDLSLYFKAETESGAWPRRSELGRDSASDRRTEIIIRDQQLGATAGRIVVRGADRVLRLARLRLPPSQGATGAVGVMEVGTIVPVVHDKINGT